MSASHFGVTSVPQEEGAILRCKVSKIPVIIDGQNPLQNGLVLTNDGRTLIVDNTLVTVFWALRCQA
jgi:hypothetical protein